MEGHLVSGALEPSIVYHTQKGSQSAEVGATDPFVFGLAHTERISDVDSDRVAGIVYGGAQLHGLATRARGVA